MPVYILSPNLLIVNRYVTKTGSLEFDEIHTHYVPKQLNLELQWEGLISQDAFQPSYVKLVKDNGLSEHADNLLYIILYCYDRMWSYIETVHEDYKSTLRAREIAELLIMLKELEPNAPNEIRFRFTTQRTDETSSAKTTDVALNWWIKETIFNGLINQNFPTRVFGSTVSEILSECKGIDNEDVNISKLKEFQKKRLVNYNNSVNKGLAAVCLTLLAYLNGETKLTNKGVKSQYKDAQLRFLYDLLALLKQINDEHNSSKEDFIRSLINNVSKRQVDK